jgi:SLOG in TRPM, prokaryote
MQTTRIEEWGDLASAMAELGFARSTPTLVSTGAASSLGADESERLEPLYAELTEVVERSGAVVVDGGTDRGVMRLLGRARARRHSFPLLGVVVAELVAPTETGPEDDRCPLEPNHTHALLVPGKEWGDEVPWLARVATVLADGKPSATVLVNGGEISYADAEASIAEGRPVLVAAGSGGTADKLAAAVRGDATLERARALADSELVRAVDMSNRAKQALSTEVERILSERN